VRISVSNAGYTTLRGSVKVLANHSILHFPLHFPSRASPCAIRFRTHSTCDLLIAKLAIEVLQELHDVGGASGTCGEGEGRGGKVNAWFGRGIMQEKDRFEDLGLYGGIVLIGIWKRNLWVYVERDNLAAVRDKVRALVNSVLNFQFP